MNFISWCRDNAGDIFWTALFFALILWIVFGRWP